MQRKTGVSLLEFRMPRVENPRRVVSTLAFVLFLGVLVASYAGQQVGEKPAGGFELKDSKGTTRALLAIAKDNKCELSLFDQIGRKRIAMAVSPDGTPQFYCQDENLKRRVNIDLEHDSGAPRFFLSDASGIARVLVTIENEKEGGIANITLFNEKGDHRVGLSAFPGKEASLGMDADKDQKGGITIGLKADGAPSAVIYDRSGNRFIDMGSDDDENLCLSICHANGDSSIRIGARQRGEPLFEFSAPEPAGRARWNIAGPDLTGGTSRPHSSSGSPAHRRYGTRMHFARRGASSGVAHIDEKVAGRAWPGAHK